MNFFWNLQRREQIFVVSAGIAVVLILMFLLVVDPLSALVVVLTLPLLPAFAALIGAATRDDTQRRWAALSSLAGHFVDVMRGLPTLVAYGRAERQVEVVADVSRRHRIATMRTLRLAFLSSAALELLASISVAAASQDVPIHPIGVGPVRFDRHCGKSLFKNEPLGDLGARPIKFTGSVGRFAEQDQTRGPDQVH